MAGAERRQRISAEIAERTGITEAMIERLVHAFYTKVRADEVLGPVFDARIRDWEPHLSRMCAFWSSVALMTGRYFFARSESNFALISGQGAPGVWTSPLITKVGVPLTP